ncbi:MAG: ATP-binding protein [Mariprofundus sp.]
MRKLSQAVEQAGESIVITDRQGVIEYANPAFTTLTGYSAEEAIGQTPRLLKSGNQDAAFYEQMWSTISSGKVWHGKVIDKKKDGSFYPTTLTISPIHSESREITHFVGIQSDLTRLEDLEHQFHQAQKMEAIGTLVGGIAHDFNNMLAGITGNLYLARQHTRDMPEVVHKLSSVEEISMRAADMIGQLLTFARKDRVSIDQMAFNPFLKETLKLLHASVPENIAMQQEICSEPLIINGDGTQLHQVLLNLINNARDAVEDVDQPCMTVRLESFYADAAFISSHSWFREGTYAHLSVEDNGMGIPEHQVEHLFEPFFTTKEQGKGTGLGLAMVFGAIKTHNGFVEVESIEGRGSTFHIYIPLLEQKAAMTAPADRKQEVAAGHGELILLADDEEHVLETGKEVLESLGYRVLTAADGQQAVELFEAHADAIDLVIMDVIMPVLIGSKAAESMRRIRPQVKIIFSTGYDQYSRANMKNEIVLGKPFSIVEMSHLIRRQLDD